MHMHWVLFLQKFNFVIRHKARECNKVADVLNIRSSLLIVVNSMITHMESLQKMYEEDVDFSKP